MKIELLPTGDGSHTLYLPELDETYHSRKGALTESLYVYIGQGLKAMAELKNLSILEFGFGTGMNAWLSLLDAKSSGQHIHYYSVELYPLAEEEWIKLNHANSNQQDQWKRMMSAPWNSETAIESNFTLHKMKSDFLNIDLPKNSIDLIYYDAFAPSKQPEVWSQEYLQKTFELLKPDGILVTYCAQGQFKRDLKACGFETERLPGPPGKAEMTRAKKPSSK